MKKLLLPLLLMSVSACYKEGDKTPLGWCVWEIQKREKYEDCTYTYQEVRPLDYKKESRYSLDAYIITTYTDEFRTEWYCFIEYKKTLKKYLNESDIYDIDCDMVWEIKYDDWGYTY